MKLSDELKALIKKKKFTQEYVAREIGVALPTVRRWIHGQYEPSRLGAERLESFLKAHSEGSK